MIKVQGYPGLYRDENTGAIVNCNDSEYRHRLNKINAVDSQREEINRLRSELDELKSLLYELTKK
jgi:hypothetical protein|tara:strand:- start:412 stop:606 length:195 start_codon:yes stop_codon:yes gene_type:complete